MPPLGARHFYPLLGVIPIPPSLRVVVYSAEPARYNQQIQKSMVTDSLPEEPLLDVQAITILVALIKHRDITVEEILALPEVKASKISSKSLQRFLEYHSLQKKTPDTRH